MYRYLVGSILMAGLALVGCGGDDRPLASAEDPHLVALAPVPGQSFIPPEQVFTAEFSEPMDQISVEAAFQIAVAQKPVAGSFAWNQDGTAVGFQPTGALAPGAEVQVAFGPGMRSRQGRPLAGPDGQRLASFAFACQTYASPATFATNGERIYFTGTSASGQPITWVMSSPQGTWGPLGPGQAGTPGYGPMMGGYGMSGGMMGGAGGYAGGASRMGMTCASCHAPDGSGGRYLAMGMVRTPNIQYAVLTGQRKVEESASGGTGSEEFVPYTDALIEQAITQGLEPNGKSLNPFMPRWSMSDQDLEDLLVFLKTL